MSVVRCASKWSLISFLKINLQCTIYQEIFIKILLLQKISQNILQNFVGIFWIQSGFGVRCFLIPNSNICTEPWQTYIYENFGVLYWLTMFLDMVEAMLPSRLASQLLLTVSIVPPFWAWYAAFIRFVMCRSKS